MPSGYSPSKIPNGVGIPAHQRSQIISGYGNRNNRVDAFGKNNNSKLTKRIQSMFDRASKKVQPHRDEVAANSLTTGKDPHLLDSGEYTSDGRNAYEKFVNYNASDEMKETNILTWRQMALDIKVGNVLDDICDACINTAPGGNVIKIQYNSLDIKTNSNMMRNISEEFEKFISLFNLKRDGWGIFRSFFVDAEVGFELIGDPNDPRRGIIGANRLKIENLFPIRHEEDYEQILGFYYRRPDDDEEIGLLREQLVYVGSGLFTETMEHQVPFIHRAMKAWRQCTLLEDSAVIYRIVRAPERRVFNVNTGNMPKTRAEKYIQKLISQYKQKKVYDPKTGELNGQYNPISMSEDYWFATRNGQDQTKVETLPGGQNLGQIEDIKYFNKQFMDAMKVPSTRDTTAGSTGSNAPANGQETDREEIKFAKFIMRQQDMLANELKEGFITHLSMIGMWSQYGLSENDFDFFFNEPNHYKERIEIDILNTRVDSYNKFKEDDYFSKEYLARSILKLTDEQIQENEYYKKKTIKGVTGEDGPSVSGGDGGELSFGGGGGGPAAGPPITGEEEEDSEPEMSIGDLGDSLQSL